LYDSCLLQEEVCSIGVKIAWRKTLQ